MKRRMAALFILVLILAGTLPHAAGQEDEPLQRLLAFVPAASTAREWLTYGDIEAWHESWNVPRLSSVDELNQLDDLPRAQWMMIMPRQTMPPQVLGLNYVLADDMRGFYGFDVFQVDRAIEAGTPPGTVTIAEHHADPAAIDAALRAAGYEVQALDGGWSLYRLGEDNAMLGLDFEGPRPGMLGQLNRIAINENLLLIARGTPALEAALAAARGDSPSLAEEAAYAAVALALESVAPEGAGGLLGALFVPGTQFLMDPAQFLLGEEVTEEQIEALRESMEDPTNQLPAFPLAGFGTHHGPDATYLTVAVALLPGADADAFAAKVADRMERYVSLATGQPLAERWAPEDAGALEVEGVPVGWVTMRVDDPPPAAEGEPANTGVLSWADLVMRRDLGFLVSGAPVE